MPNGCAGGIIPGVVVPAPTCGLVTAGPEPFGLGSLLRSMLMSAITVCRVIFMPVTLRTTKYATAAARRMSTRQAPAAPRNP